MVSVWYYHDCEILSGLNFFDVFGVSGLADPYLRGKLGAYRFKTDIKRKTLSPTWQEEFKIPIFTWDSPSILNVEVKDKDHFVDDTLGFAPEPSFHYSKPVWIYQ